VKEGAECRAKSALPDMTALRAPMADRPALIAAIAAPFSACSETYGGS
jgi:hypothetical protein